jgi:predicted small secreted protein
MREVIPAFQELLMRISMITTLALVAGLALSACNTVSGAGKDMSSAGKAVTKTANDVKN